MARPERNTVDYFPFYCEEGKKMFYIEETYGNDGFATFIKLLRELAKTENHYLDLSKPMTAMFLSAKCKVQKDVMMAIINDLADLGKFDQTLWNDNKIIWCQDFIDSIQDAYKKRNNKCITYQGLLLLLEGLGVRKPGKLPTIGDGNTQRKEKEIKEKESKVNDIPVFDEVLVYAKEKEPSVCPRALKLKYDSWVENDWRDGNGSPIKKWKVKLLNTLPFIAKIPAKNVITGGKSIYESVSQGKG